MRTPTLAEREYLTPAQAVRVFGHNVAFWREAFDSRKVDGYTYGHRRDRHLRTESIREFLRTQPGAQTVQPIDLDWRARMREFRAQRQRDRSAEQANRPQDQTT